MPIPKFGFRAKNTQYLMECKKRNILGKNHVHLFRSLNNYLRGKRFKKDEVLNFKLKKFCDSKLQESYTNGFHDLSKRRAEFMKIKGRELDK